MTVIDLIANFQIFKIGDFAIIQTKLVHIRGLPYFSHRANYTDGDYDYMSFTEFEKVRRPYSLVGYQVDMLSDDKLTLRQVELELLTPMDEYRESKYPKYIADRYRFKMLLEHREIENKLRNG